MASGRVRLAELVDENLLEIGAGRPRSEGAHLPVLRVADVLDGHVQASIKPDGFLAHYPGSGPKASRAGDIVLTTKGTVGRVAIMPLDGPTYAYSPQLCYFRPLDDDSLAPRYLYYWFRSAEFWRQADAVKAQTDMADFISLQDVYSLKMWLPSIDEQRAIAEILGALDDKIVANDRAARTMDQLIATHHAAAIAEPDVSSQPLFDVIDVVFGEAFKGENFTDRGNGRPLIRIRDLKTADPQVWTSEVRPKETLIQPGDVVVGMDAEFRATWWLGDPGLLNQRVLRATARFASPAFAAEALRRPLAAVESEKSATTVIHLNKSDLERTSVEVPGVDALARFDAIAEPLRLARVTLALESRKFAAARDELLPLLMSGKVHVKGAETSVEGVL